MKSFNKYLFLFLVLTIFPLAGKAQKDIKKSCISTVLFQATYAYQFPGLDTKVLYGNNSSAGGSVIYKTDKNWLWSFNGNFIFGDNIIRLFISNNDEYINVRNKIGNDSKVILQIQRVLATCNLQVYNRSEDITEPYYEKEDFTGKLASEDTIEMQLKLLKYKIYPIFVHDIIEGDCCKVTIYKSQYMYNFTNFVNSPFIQAGNLEDINNLRKKIVYSPEEVYLMDGYIHASQLHPISVIRVKDTI